MTRTSLPHEMGREVKTSILMKLAPKQMHMRLQLRHCPPNHVSHTHGRDPMFRSRCCVCAEPRRSHGAGCSGDGKHGPWQKQCAQTVLERARNRSKATVKIVRANTTKSEQLVHVIGAAEKGILWLTACQLHPRRLPKYQGRH